MLATDRRRSFGMRDEQHEQDPWQGSLFGPDSLAPPVRSPRPTPDPFAGAHPASAAAAAPPASGTAPIDGPATTGAAAPSASVATPPDAAEAVDAAHAAAADLLAPATEPAEVIEPADYLDDTGELEPAHALPATARSLLAGPTLDDIMSRAWEGLRAEVPTPCPVCHTEIEPSAGGRCGACGSTLD